MSLCPTCGNVAAPRESAGFRLLRVIEEHAKAHNVTVEQVIGRSRALAVVEARRAAIRDAKEKLGLSDAEIGWLLDRSPSGVRRAAEAG